MSLFVFLIKSTACLALFLLFYKLVLEQERMHVFKRFYLLAALLLSFVIPSITFTEYIEIASVPEETILMDRTVSEEVRLSPDSPEAEVTSTIESPVQDITDHWPVLLWSLYGIGVFVFILKFLRTLWTIGRNIRSNPKIKLGKTINVLLGDAVVPHTFFNYIFLNRKDYEDKRIADEVLLHERTHARQIHSLDVLFVELLQIVFWFDPLIYLTKKSIKLNHEFLADQAVLERGASTATYQKILLAFASSATGHNNQSSLANAINYSSYSSIKKRFTVMRTQTSRKSVLLRSILLLPLVALLTYGFSDTVLVPVQIPDTEELSSLPEETQEGATSEQIKEYNALAKRYNKMLAKKGNLRIKKQEVDRLENLYELMTNSQRAKAEPFPDFPEPPAPPSPPMPPDQSSVEVEEIALSRLDEREASKDERKMRGQRVLTENQKAQMERQAEKLAEQSAKMQENASRMKTQQIDIEEQMEEMETRIQQIIDNQEIIVEGTGNINLMNYALPQEPSAVGVSEHPVFSSSNGEVEMKGETPSTPPAPPTPPKPKSPLELLHELKDENAKIIFNGKEISYEQAEKLFQENTFSRVNLKKQTGMRPILKVRTK